MSKKWVLLITFLAFSFLFGCTGNDTYEAIGEDPTILIHHLEGGMDEELKGILKYDSEIQTLYIESHVKDAPETPDVTPIWPEGTTTRTENGKHGVDIPDYGTVMVGDEIEGGGGGVDESDLNHLDVSDEYLEKRRNFVVSNLD